MDPGQHFLIIWVDRLKFVVAPLDSPCIWKVPDHDDRTTLLAKTRTEEPVRDVP
ncbi:hypothetical protein RRSWK_06096 [Rhodopirellula sp. SWK7]|nr:hypothetical protein RRSWK_06096 [Rhodopirellula sp. SWK7]